MHLLQLFPHSFLGLSQSLPVTSYVKMIDIWMLFTMTVPFLEVVMHTTNEAFKQPRVDNFDNECQVNVVSVMPTQEQVKEKDGNWHGSCHAGSSN